MRRPKDYCQISAEAVESGWAVSPWWNSDEVMGWSRRVEAKRRGEITPGLDLGRAGLS